MKSKRKVARRRVATKLSLLPPRDSGMERLIRRLEDATDALNRIDSALRTLHTLLDKRL